MKRNVVINGRVYPTVEVTFNTICEFEDMGVPMAEIEKKSVMLLRAYAALCMGKKAADAGAEIEQHIVNGGSFDDIAAALTEAIEESGFFQALSKRAEETDSEGQTQAE